MGQQNSKDEMVYQKVVEGNIEAIKALVREGVGLEWIDKEGKTPLIVACMDHRLYMVAKTLIELGANVNAYRPGRHAGTPLHHASKRGLDHAVKLLLSNGAKPFARNDDCQTPLDVARMKGHSNVVRAIEAHICCFSGDIREILVIHGILEPLVPQRLSRKRSKMSWVVVVPYSPPDARKPPKLELAVYSSVQDPQPRAVISLWKCDIAEPKFHESDPALVISDQSSGTRYKFLSAIEGDKQQLTQLYSACKGFPKPPTGTPALSTVADAEAIDLAMAHIASIQSAGNNRPEFPSDTNTRPSPVADNTNGWGDVASSTAHNEGGPSGRPTHSKAGYSGWADQPAPEEYNGWSGPESTLPTPPQQMGSQEINVTAPSAPPLPGDILDDGHIHYPAIDLSPVDLTVPTAPGEASTSSKANSETAESLCVICWESPIEGACVPCGHMAGCMSCLSEIKSKKGVCPVCRAKMDQIIRVYAV